MQRTYVMNLYHNPQPQYLYVNVLVVRLIPALSALLGNENQHNEITVQEINSTYKNPGSQDGFGNISLANIYNCRVDNKLGERVISTIRMPYRTSPFAYWYDNDIRFDLMTRYLRPCTGEIIFEALEPVEDTKGNNGESGRLIITNLRLVWQSKKFPKINLSIGYNPITSISVKSATSKLRGLTEALHILAKTRTSRYEFIFTNLVVDHNRLFAVVIAVQRAYTQSKLYREIKMRSGMIVTNKKLNMLPQEQICEQINGVWNLSSDQGNLGSFFITTVRVVWYAASNELFNASIPFLQIAEIKVRDSKFGKALVIETTETGGNYVLGFRIDPKEKLQEAFKTLLSIQEAFAQHPVYGVDFNADTLDQETEVEKKHRLQSALVDEVEEVDENPEMASDAFAAYYADGAPSGNHLEIVFCEELGLAIEKPKEGFTIQSLWEVIPTS